MRKSQRPASASIRFAPAGALALFFATSSATRQPCRSLNSAAVSRSIRSAFSLRFESSPIVRPSNWASLGARTFARAALFTVGSTSFTTASSVAAR